MAVEPQWRNILRADDAPWIRQHALHGKSLYPMAGFMAMAMEAAVQMAILQKMEAQSVELRDITMEQMLLVPDASEVEVITSMKLHNGSSMRYGAWYEFKIFSWPSERKWLLHCKGFVIAKAQKAANSVATNNRNLRAELSSVQDRCTERIDIPALYSNISECGVQYGPLFRSVKSLFYSHDGASAALVEIPHTRDAMPFAHESGMIVHPITLDLLMQTIWVFVGFYQSGHHDSYLASSIKHMELNLTEKTSAGQIFEYVATQNSGHVDRGATVHALLEDAQDAWITIRGLKSVRVQNVVDAVTATPRALCYKETFKASLDFLSNADPSISQRMAGVDEVEEQRQQLMADVASSYIRKAVETIPTELDCFSPHHKKLHQWMVKMCAATTTPDRDAAAVDRLRQSGDVGALLCKIGSKLPEILRGDADALGLMMEDDLLGKYYEQLAGYQASFSHAAYCVDMLANENPNMRILEIGAGTGSATLPVLTCLGGDDADSPPRFRDFTYTDISAGFFETAKKRLAPWRRQMTYGLLDISRDPREQGYEAHAYDLVMACNVLHATPDMEATLAHARRLLKPGGKLLLIEETVMLPRLFMFGCLPGWWLSEDAWRVDGPLLSCERWDAVLKKSRFTGTNICLPDFNSTHTSNCTIVSTAGHDLPRAGHALPQEVAIIAEHGESVKRAHELATGLAASLDIQASVAALDKAESAGKLCIFVGEMGQSLLSDMTAERFRAIQQMVNAAQGILWVTGYRDDKSRDRANLNMVRGMARSIRSERDLRFATLDLGVLEVLPSTDAVRHITRVFQRAFVDLVVSKNAEASPEMEFTVINGEVCVSRFVADDTANLHVLQEAGAAPPALQKLRRPDRRLKLEAGGERAHIGPGSGVLFTDDKSTEGPLDEDSVEIQVHCCGLNFRDVMVLMGEIDDDGVGLECSGIVTAVGTGVADMAVGDRVCAIQPAAFATHLRCPAINAHKVPEQIAMSTAASIPVIFATVYYSLVHVAHIIPGETVLIHAAAGGVGQAAIVLAQLLGATVFATVSSSAKKEFIMTRYGIEEDHIFFSRDASFGDGIRRATAGRGVDVVLNCLAGDLLRVSLELLAPFGRFVELGKRDILASSGLDMGCLARNVTVAAVDLWSMLSDRPQLIKKLLQDVFQKIPVSIFENPPYPIKQYCISELNEAVADLQSGRVIGKVVLDMSANPNVQVYPALIPNEQILQHDATYAIVGGTKGIGLSLASSLADKGARHLVLLSRSGLRGAESEQAVEGLRRRGVTVEVFCCDVVDKSAVQRVFEEVTSRMPAVRGVIYGAMVLREILFEDMDYAAFAAVVQPRVSGLWHIHDTLESPGQRLDFFVNLVSLAGVIGNHKQAAYAATSTFMGGFAAHRHALGLPCTTIDLGGVEDAGYIVESRRRQDAGAQAVVNEGMFEQTWIRTADIGNLVATAIRGRGGSCATALDFLTGPRGGIFAQDVRFSHILSAAEFGNSSGSGEEDEKGKTAKDTKSPRQAVQQAGSPAQAQGVVAEAILQKLAALLLTPAAELDASKSIGALGLDSLVAIEVRRWLSREFDVNLQLLEILASDSVPALARMTLEKSPLVTAAAA